MQFAPHRAKKSPINFSPSEAEEVADENDATPVKFGDQCTVDWIIMGAGEQSYFGNMVLFCILDRATRWGDAIACIINDHTHTYIALQDSVRSR